jgi:AcrR family transcriptional regulator
VTKTKSRNLARTRKQIIEATKTLLASEGVEAVSVAKVARLASINRSTAYDHFKSREALIDAALDAVGEQLQEAIFSSLPVDRTDEGLNEHGKKTLDELALFFVRNARLAAIWLEEFIRRKRKNDPMVTGWLKATQYFVGSSYGRPDVDAEVLTLSMLSTYLIWPLWIDSDQLSPDEQRVMAMRLSNELLRHALFGAMQPERLPKLVEDLRIDIARVGDGEDATGGKVLAAG